jgi:hypothetical protein
MPSVAFRSAKAARIHRYFRGAKGDNPDNLLFPQQKQIKIIFHQSGWMIA